MKWKYYIRSILLVLAGGDSGRSIDKVGDDVVCRTGETGFFSAGSRVPDCLDDFVYTYGNRSGKDFFKLGSTSKKPGTESLLAPALF